MISYRWWSCGIDGESPAARRIAGIALRIRTGLSRDIWLRLYTRCFSRGLRLRRFRRGNIAISLVSMNDSIDRAKPTVHHSAELVGLFIRNEINACSKADRSSDHSSCRDRRYSTRHVMPIRK
jgi:hypothetical protein